MQHYREKRCKRRTSKCKKNPGSDFGAFKAFFFFFPILFQSRKKLARLPCIHASRSSSHDKREKWHFKKKKKTSLHAAESFSE